MLLPKRTTITIHTGVEFFTAVYARVYTLEVQDRNNDRAVITLSAYNLSPSGLRKGDKHNIKLIESEEVNVPKNATAKSWLADLVLKHDPVVHMRTGCEKFNASQQSLNHQLKNQAKLLQNCG